METRSTAQFEMIETLHVGRGTVLLRGHRTADHCPVLLKVLDPVRSRPKDLEQLKREYELGTLLDTPAVVKPLALETYQGMPALVLEDGGGQPLHHLLGAPMPVGRFLPLAVAITADVAEIHARGVVHRDLKPQNILLDPATGQVKLTDFGIASRLPREQQDARPPGLIEGSLPYLSPEQTGRMNRALDDRTDLYSLGVTFYEMLTGRLPFQARDPVEWVHCHVACVPASPVELVPELPELLARVVLKLLAKMPEDRYQSARGLQLDLERCAEQWSASGRIEAFALGEHDVSDRLQIPQRLYGREAEIARLRESFARVVDTGTPELVLVSGYSGIGKSALVCELYQPIVRERARFLSGKFDQYQRDIPYATLVQAFRAPVLEILSESEERIAAWRQRLLDALGHSGQLIVDVIPQLALVIGPQPPVLELPPAEAQNRFRMVFRHFIAAFARREHPLALFLDDLQWVDSASLGLLQELLTHPETRNLLVIGAYRDNEVWPSHPLMLTLDRMRHAGARTLDIELGPLSHADLAAFIGEALHCRASEARPLADVIHEKTAGNPFFVIQFLTALYEERLIELDRAAGAFEWNVATIRAKGFTDNVVDLMVEKLARLSPGTREALQLLACLGNSENVAIFAMVHGCSEPEAHALLWEAVRAGLVLRLDDTYEFLHDRVQEAAYSFIPAELRAQVHLDIGRRLSSRLPESAIAERLFDVANQWNRGAHLLTDPHERAALCRLDVRAGLKAKGAIAYTAARGYLTQAAALLPPDAWTTQYEDTFALYMALAECEYLIGNFDTADTLVDLILAHARSLLDRARAYRSRMRLYQIAGRHHDAVTVMLEAMRLFGVTLPESDEEIDAAVQAEMQQIATRLRGRSVAELVGAPVTTDANVRAIIGLLAEAMPFVYSARPALWPLITSKGVNISLQHGHADESAFVYVCHAMVLVSPYGDVAGARQLSELALRVNETFRNTAATLRGKMLMIHAAHVIPWCQHFSTSLPMMEQAYRACLDAGDLVHSGYLTYNMIWLAFEAGDPLDQVIELARKYTAFARQTHNDVVYRVVRLQEQLAASLQGATRSPSSFDDGSFDEAEAVAALEARSFGVGLAHYRIMKQVAALIQGRYAESLAWAERAAPLLRQVGAFPIEATHQIHHALALAALHTHAPAEQQQQLAAVLAQLMPRLERWARDCPENFRHHRALVSAEGARVAGRILDAERLYEEAIRSAREHGFVQHEALAYELAARFYRARGFDTFADAYLREARACFARWGADGKVAQLDRHHPHLRPPRPLAATDTFVAAPAQLDLHAVVKALQSISSEILLPRLGETLLRIMVQQAGGQRAALLLVRGGELVVHAEATTDGTEIRVASLQGAPAAGAALPMSILHYVARTSEPVLLDDAAGSTRFASDPYIAGTHPRSLLCLPIVRQGCVSGLVYLENNLATGTFTTGTLQVLELLGAQAAISLDNATLYTDLERSRMEIATVLDNMVDSVFVADRTGHITMANDAATRLAGRTSMGAMRQSVEELAREMHFVHPDGAPYQTEQIPLMRALHGETVALDEGALARPDAERTQYLHTSASPMRDAGGQVVGAVAVVRDVTALVELDRLKDQFLRVIAHELKTPVAVIMGYAEMLTRGRQELTPGQRRIVDGLLRGAERIDRIVSDLVFLSQVQLDRLHPVLERVDLGALLERVAAGLGQAPPSGRIRITCAEPVVLQADRELLERVAMHLLDNALRYSPPGSEVAVDVRVAGARDAVVSVRDRGVGIPPEKHAQIFERFFRAHTDTPHDYGGMGTGLYLSRAIVARHGGEIWFESEEERGSSFHVRLPLTRAGATEAARGAARSETASRSTLQRQSPGRDGRRDRQRS
jgi:PAS domain S-box-containing protein